MTRLRYNGLRTCLGTALAVADTTVTFDYPLSSAAGAVPTIAAGDYIALTLLDRTRLVTEIVHLTAYTSGALTGTIARGQEGTAAVTHETGSGVEHWATVDDFAASAGSPTVWTAVTTFQNGWTNYGSPYQVCQYRTNGDLVEIRGLMKGGTLGTAFTLPVGLRPPANIQFAVEAGGAHGSGEVRSTGEFRLNAGANTAVSVNTAFSVTA